MITNVWPVKSALYRRFELLGGSHITKAKMVAQVSLLAMGLALAGCGGGGGAVGSTPTPPPAPTPPAPPPPPPPPPPPNTSLLNLTSSESFTNDAATGIANFPKTGTGQTATAAPSTATVSYDLATRGYTITVGSRSQTFRPTDIDIAQSNAGVTVYPRRNGTTTDSLTLTKPGTSGRFTYEYVGGGYWQQTIDGATAVSGSLDAFAYGIKTPDAAVPRTGQAVYAVDLLGATTLTNDVVGITGEGNVIVNFGGGNIIVRGSIVGTPQLPSMSFSGSATLSATANNFTGPISISSPLGPLQTGTWNGRFYGPAAQEVGGAFGVSNGVGGATTGTIIGRRNTALGGNATIINPTKDDLLAGDAARLAFTGNPGVPVSAQSNGSGAISVYYDASDGTYDLLLSDRSGLIRNLDFIFNQSLNNSYGGVDSTRNFAVYVRPTLQYLRTGRAYTIVGNRYTFDDIVFGIATPDGSVPRTGQAGFALLLTGSIAETGAANLQTISGQGTMTANFATGAMTTQGSLNNYFGANFTAIGAFNGTATLAGNANTFSGTLNFTGVGAYSGPLRGRFYGPAINEIGAVFSLAGPNGGIATGTLTGANDPNVLAAQSGLLDLTQSTTLAGTAAAFVVTPALSPGQSTAFVAPMSVTYDPVAKSYQFVSNAIGNVPAAASFPISVVATERVAAESNASFDVYRNGVTTTKIFKPGTTNPTLALTYTSFADITTTGVDFGGRATTYTYALPFGIQTPLIQMPRAGTAVYSGIAYGFGQVDQVGSRVATIDGTSRFDVDFGLGTVSTLLTLNARNPATSATASLGQFLFSGTMGGGVPGGGVGSNSFVGRNGNTNFQGALNGLFFGANAAEIGIAFSIDKQDLLVPGSPKIQIEGAAIGKRGP
jgi:C-lobe and N-lobe beta barrels of Tf-binding protein B